jgi:hypothetical protein
MGADAAPEVYTLVPPDPGPGPPIRSLEEWQRLSRFPRGQGGWEWPGGPPPAAPPVGRLVFRRHPDGRVTVDGFPDEADVCEALVARLAPALAAAVRLERGRLYVEAANGAAVYVPVGPSPRPGCVRYGRLYLRPAAR